jgi:predicted enzyme related to lactoylglutathione lyase
MNPVIHFEMPAEDRQRMVDFYTRTFGWQANMMGPEMGEYVVVMTTESTGSGPTKPGAINGGFFKKTEPSQCPSVVIAVDDIREHMKKVEEAGGKTLGGMTAGEPDDIPGVGLYAAFVDTEGNRVGMLQPAARMSVSPGSGSSQ